MPEEYQDYVTPMLSEFNTKLRDTEEKHRLLKERVLLIGQNLVDSKEELEKDVTDMKIDVQEIKEDIKKIKASLIRTLEELEKRARRSELEMLERQFKIFDPLKK